MNSPRYFELQAEEPARAAGFYGAVFGWEIERDASMPLELWRFQTPDGLEGAIYARPAPAPPRESGTNAAVLSIQVADYDATEALVLAHGGVVAMPRFAVPGRCWQGYYLDSEGNTFGVFQLDPDAR